MKKIIRYFLLIYSLMLFSSNLSSMNYLPKIESFKIKAKDLIVGDNFRIVCENLCYRSKQLSADYLKYYLKKYNIKYIINLCNEEEIKESWYKEELAIADEFGATVIDIPLHRKDMPTKAALMKLINFYREHSNDPILIHCLWGIDRTGLATFLWKFLIQGKSKDEAYNEELNCWVGRPWWTHYKWNRPNMDKFVSICPSNRDEFDKWLFDSYDELAANS